MLLTATMWWPLSARLAAAFLVQGVRVATASPRGHPMRFVTGVSGHFAYGGTSAIEELTSAINLARPALIVPCDDGAVRQLQSLHESTSALRPLIEHSLGPPRNYPILRSRARFLAVAAELGIRTPTTRVIASPDGLPKASNAQPIVLKIDGSSGGNGVQIVRSNPQAVAAFRRLAAPMSSGYVWKRLLIDCDHMPLWSRHQGEQPAITAQQYIAGRPANAMLACWHGELLAMITVEVLSALGPTGAATVVRIIENDEISRAARLLTHRLRLTGFHGLDFIIQDGTATAFLIELNPRATQLGHLRLSGQGDLVHALAARLMNRPLPLAPNCMKSEIVAFFPQAMSLNPASEYLKQGHHDIPWDQPALHRELQKAPWPNRRLLARIYHFLRPQARYSEASFPTE